MGKNHTEQNQKKSNPEEQEPQVLETSQEQELTEEPEIEILSEETTSVSTEEFNRLKKELEEAQKQAADNFNGWQRERADFSNYKKRIEREQQQIRQTISGEIIKKYLVALDDIERALKNRPAEGEGATWAEGIELISRKLKSILESEGITRIPAETESFDPCRHEAISSEDSADHKSGEIIEILQQGYMFGDRVLRPALVRVAR